ncbi:(2,3-dihydroxybenzoyl)adenylate synthase [Halobacillus salinarum]|uniref:(2,3-dihydroxybenzoyl)adenylate synthase n=1 Tax=Halobacillus salinarum TaxID=2932257 RepID=A0ABY4EDR9_9BACI|nr:(2,3-dihydroxybenzoyl)adenylate synthase [Halobacillus salinarum]UOQ42592.1 (2,3-dihydroxybenzoyl)adenylate synthase [Halobacillus salinarum]
MLSDCPLWPEELAEHYREIGCWRGETFGSMLRQKAELYGNKTAITNGKRKITYAELDMQSNQLAAGFSKLGIQKDNRVVVQLPNDVEFFQVIFALFKIGALPVFALPSHRSSEVEYFCEFTEAQVYIIPDSFDGYDYRKLARKMKDRGFKNLPVIVAGDPEEFISLSQLFHEPFEKEFEVSSHDIAFLQLSGGSTGKPKLIPRTHDDYIYSLKKSNEVCLMNEESVYLAVLPVAHNFPLSSPGVLGTLYAGGRIVLSSGSSPDEAFPLIEQERVTITAVVPPIAMIWMQAVKSRNWDLSSLKVMQVGGAKFSSESAKNVKPAFGCVLQQVFGMAEGLVNYTRLDDPEDVIVHTQGRPMSPYDEIKIVDEEDQEVERGEVGELLTRGPYTIRGYYKTKAHNAKAFTSDGYYRTGDLVKLDHSGNIIVEGRDKDQINRGGEKIAAEEIENHLLAHPEILDAAVVAMPDEYLGERACAYIIRLDKGKPSPVELREFLNKREIAAYKIPDRFEFVSEFPKTALGKVSKKSLREKIAIQLKNKKYKFLSLERK